MIDLTQRMRRWRGLTADDRDARSLPRRRGAGAEFRPGMLPPAWRPTAAGGRARGRKAGRGGQGMVREVPSAQPAQFVAVFQKDEQSPAFLRQRRYRQADRDGAAGLSRASHPTRPINCGSHEPGSRTEARSASSASDEFTVRAALRAYDPAGDQQRDVRDFARAARAAHRPGAPTGPVIHAKLVQARRKVFRHKIEYPKKTSAQGRRRVLRRSLAKLEALLNGDFRRGP